MPKSQTFTDWLESHGCTTEELWKIQNCIGSLWGFDHPIAKEAAKAWMDKAADDRVPKPHF